MRFFGTSSSTFPHRTSNDGDDELTVSLHRIFQAFESHLAREKRSPSLSFVSKEIKLETKAREAIVSQSLAGTNDASCFVFPLLWDSASKRARDPGSILRSSLSVEDALRSSSSPIEGVERRTVSFGRAKGIRRSSECPRNVSGRNGMGHEDVALAMPRRTRRVPFARGRRTSVRVAAVVCEFEWKERWTTRSTNTFTTRDSRRTNDQRNASCFVAERVPSSRNETQRILRFCRWFQTSRQPSKCKLTDARRVHQGMHSMQDSKRSPSSVIFRSESAKG